MKGGKTTSGSFWGRRRPRRRVFKNKLFIWTTLKTLATPQLSTLNQVDGCNFLTSTPRRVLMLSFPAASDNDEDDDDNDDDDDIFIGLCVDVCPHDHRTTNLNLNFRTPHRFQSTYELSRKMSAGKFINRFCTIEGWLKLHRWWLWLPSLQICKMGHFSPFPLDGWGAVNDARVMLWTGPMVFKHREIEHSRAFWNCIAAGLHRLGTFVISDHARHFVIRFWVIPDSGNQWFVSLNAVFFSNRLHGTVLSQLHLLQCATP